MPEPETTKDDAELTRRLLSVAFNDKNAVAMEPVPEVLHKLGSVARPVVLRDAEGVEPPIVRPGHPEPSASGRIEVIGEIARGGMGVIYKGRDTVLGRDVALKTMHRRHSENQGLRNRFIEEAQICSQLHHPGIVPVHDMGLLDDGRPYFLMKLLSGETLASMLTDRRDRRQERRRYLDIFDRICQAVAYAHARGVVHRDIKPSNILVGGFGEIQVMDWGLAKVVPRGGLADELRARESEVTEPVHTVRTGAPLMDSLCGSVFGTAPYMAPEQARGQVEAVNERTDVFSLGAILLEILTGHPPYVGNTQEEVLSQAAAGDLHGARERLRRSTTDADLLSLVGACLSPDRADRPRDAGVVSKVLSDYLSSVEDRAHQAELSAVQQRTRAENERRSRRQSVALIGVVMLAAVFSSLYLWAEQQRREGQRATDLAISHAMERARLLGDQAGAESFIEIDTWTRALAAARDAEALARDSDVDPTMNEEARRLVVDLEGSRAAAAEARDLARLLEETRPDPFDGRSEAQDDVEYARAFRKIGVEADTITAVGLSDRIRQSPIADTLVSALDEWAFIRQHTHDRDFSTPWKVLVDGAILADPDPLRARVRRSWAASDLEGLQAAAEAAEFEGAASWTMRLLARSLVELGDSSTAVDVYRAAQLRHPQDYRLSHDLARLLNELPDVPLAEVVRLLSIAVTARPDSALARVDLALAFAGSGECERAHTLLTQARRIDPDFAHLDCALGKVRLLQGDYDGAGIAYERVIRSGVGHRFFELGLLMQGHRLFDVAADAYRLEIERRPGRAEAHCNLGTVLLELGRSSAALEALRKGHALGSRRGTDWTYPSEEWVLRAEQSLALEPLLGAVLAGQDPPADPGRRLELATLADAKRLYRTAAELYASALADGAADLCRHCAARAALDAGLGFGDEGADLDEPTRASWREQARRWLEHDLDSLRATEQSDRARGKRWLAGPRLSRIRSGPLFNRLSPNEREAWASFWARVETLVGDTR